VVSWARYMTETIYITGISFPYITAAHFSERKKLFKLFFIYIL